MNWENDTFLCGAKRTEETVSARSKNESYGKFLLRQASRSRADHPTFDKWYRKTHKKVYPVTVMGMPADEEAEIQMEDLRQHQVP